MAQEDVERELEDTKQDGLEITPQLYDIWEDVQGARFSIVGMITGGGKEPEYSIRFGEEPPSGWHQSHGSEQFHKLIFRRGMD